LTSNEHANWHPVTWLSHALDCQLFGLDAGFHHLTSLAIHAANVLLLFVILLQATEALGCSFWVAALFAWHPLNVETVAWAAERKSLLCMLFFLLAVGAYGWYARQPGVKRLFVVFGFFILALASKPMAVTLPFVLLLLDYWPLQRVAGWTEIPSTQANSNPQQSIRRLLLEKVPLFLLSAASCAVTVWAQKSGGAVRSLQVFPLHVRIANALYAYLMYICKMILPFGLSVFYPHPGASLAIWKPALAAVLLCATAIAVWKQRSKRPYLLVGWFWFLGTLVPVIGVMQVGDQAMADRYTYVPLIGLFVMIVWGGTELFDRRRLTNVPRWAAAITVLGALCFITARQLAYWETGVTIWSHALQVTEGNLQIEKQLANAMVRQDENEEAVPHLMHIASLDPKDVSVHVNLGAYYASKARVQDSVTEFQTAIKLIDQEESNSLDRKYRSSALLNLGLAYAVSKNYAQALETFERANQSDPAMVNQVIEAYGNSLATAPSEGSYLKVSLLLRAKGQNGEASSMLQVAATANPDYVDVRQLLEYLNGVRPAAK
jgi:Tfp pilus assembly protein PilF